MSQKKKKRREPKEPVRLRNAWQKLVCPATRNLKEVYSRLSWKGIPTGRNEKTDPWALIGLRLDLEWFASTSDRDSYLNGSLVSQIEIVAYRGCFIQKDGKVVYEYEIAIRQLVDLDSAYGQALERQRIRGIFDRDCGGVNERTAQMLLLIGSTTTDVRKLLAYHGAVAPSFTLLQVPQIVRDEPDSDRVPGFWDNRLRIVDELSDLEIDRIWELGGMVAEWLQDIEGNIKAQHKKLVRLEREYEEAKIPEAPAKKALDAILEKCKQAQTEISRIEENLTREKKKLADALSVVDTELRRARIRLTNHGNETGRIRGLVMEQLRKVGELARTGMSDTSEAKDSEARYTRLKSQFDNLPKDQKRIEEEIAKLMQKRQTQEQLMSEPVKVAKQELEKKKDALVKVEAEKLSAQITWEKFNKKMRDAGALVNDFR